MKWIGRLPLTRDVVEIEVHLGWTVTIYAAVQLPIIGEVVLRVIREVF